MNNEIATVVFTEKAYLGIVAETYERIHTETGGIFLGKYNEDVWYVLETLDPGPNSIFRTAYFEYDDNYQTHLARKVERSYKYSLGIIGLWHRHPGSFDLFSATDDGTNLKFAQMHQEGAISALVNLDPSFRLTIYAVDASLNYRKTRYIVDDSKIPPEFLEQKKFQDYLPQRIVTQPEYGRTNEKIISRSIKSQPVFYEKETRSYFPLQKLFKSLLIHPNDPQPKRISEDSKAKLDEEKVDELLSAFTSELDYLDTQTDYEYKMKISEDYILVIVMNYLHSLDGYPINIDFSFKLTPKGKRLCKFEGNIYHYKENFIHSYINSKINSFFS